MNELILTESKSLRNENVGRVEVLVQFGVQSSGKYYTKTFVANLFQVPEKTIESLVDYHRDELELDGLRKISHQEIKENTQIIELQGAEINPRGYIGFTDKSIVRTAMLLTKSEVAKQIRTKIIELIENNSKSHDVQLAQAITMIAQNLQALTGNQQALMSKQAILEQNLLEYKDKQKDKIKRINSNQDMFLMKVDILEDKLERIEKDLAPVVIKRESTEILKKTFYEEDFYTVSQ